jgi:hypothetical protein
MLMIDAALTDDELTELALAADPRERLEPDAVALTDESDDWGAAPAVGYMPAPIATRGRDRCGALRLQSCSSVPFVTITALGFCHHVRQPRGCVVPSAPLAHGSISLRIYPHDLEPQSRLPRSSPNAVLAEEAGFDGVMTQEHHGGFPNYLPNPLLNATWALEQTSSLWAPRLVRSCCRCVRGRSSSKISRGHRIGSRPSRLRGRRRCVPARLRDGRRTVRRDAHAVRGGAARGRGGVGGPRDRTAGRRTPASRHWRAPQYPSSSPRKVLWPCAGRRGSGSDSSTTRYKPWKRTRALSDLHVEEGGAGPRILIRRVWLGPTPVDALNAQMLDFAPSVRRVFREHWDPGGGLVTAEDGAELAQRLYAAWSVGRC